MEIDVFTALTSAGVSEADARAAAKAIRKDVVEEVQRSVGHLATKDDVRRLGASIDGLRGEFFQRLSDMQKTVYAMTWSAVGVLVSAMTALKYFG